LPSSASMAASAFRASRSGGSEGALNTTLPLPRTVRTAVNPAASKAARSAGIFTVVGITPLRKAA
jgi:hypothetical protein